MQKLNFTCIPTKIMQEDTVIVEYRLWRKFIKKLKWRLSNLVTTASTQKSQDLTLSCPGPEPTLLILYLHLLNVGPVTSQVSKLFQNKKLKVFSFYDKPGKKTM